MKGFQHIAPTRIIFGPGERSRLGKTAATLGRSCMVVTGRSSVRSSGLLDEVQGWLDENGVRTVVYNRILPNPHIEAVDEAARIAREAQVDFLLGVGGGSVMDAAQGHRPGGSFGWRLGVGICKH